MAGHQGARRSIIILLINVRLSLRHRKVGDSSTLCESQANSLEVNTAGSINNTIQGTIGMRLNSIFIEMMWQYDCLSFSTQNVRHFKWQLKRWISSLVLKCACRATICDRNEGTDGYDVNVHYNEIYVRTRTPQHMVCILSKAGIQLIAMSPSKLNVTLPISTKHPIQLFFMLDRQLSLSFYRCRLGSRSSNISLMTVSKGPEWSTGAVA